MRTKGKPRCKDCPADSERDAPYPGPRCATHNRERKQGQRDAAHARRIRDNYRLSVEDYWRLYEYQGGACYICQRAKGKAKRLAVDHDHACCPTVPTCGNCTRGLLCTTCNKRILGHLRDDPEALRRAARYLEEPPFREIVDG